MFVAWVCWQYDDFDISLLGFDSRFSSLMSDLRGLDFSSACRTFHFNLSAWALVTFKAASPIGVMAVKYGMGLDGSHQMLTNAFTGW